jgi:hypothetical protein
MDEGLDPLEEPEAWDYVELAGRENPGIAQVDGFDRAFGWEVKDGKGVKGAVITLNKYPPAKGSITFTLWAVGQFAELMDYLSVFNYDLTKKSSDAVDIWHPSIAVSNVKSVVCTNIGPLVHKGKGLYTLKVDLLEYWPPPKKDASNTPKGSKGFKADEHKATGAKDDPIGDAQQKQIAELLAEAKKV